MFIMRVSRLKSFWRIVAGEKDDCLKVLDKFLKTRTMIPTDIETLSVYVVDPTRILHSQIAQAINKGYQAARKLS